MQRADHRAPLVQLRRQNTSYTKVDDLQLSFFMYHDICGYEECLYQLSLQTILNCDLHGAMFGVRFYL